MSTQNKFLINGKEIEVLHEMSGWYEPDKKTITQKINELIQALGEQVENTSQCNECFDGFHENCINLLTVCACKNCAKMEEKPKWDKNNLKDGDRYWYVDAFGDAQSSSWHNTRARNWRLATGNIFETAQEAEDYKRKILGK